MTMQSSVIDSDYTWSGSEILGFIHSELFYPKTRFNFGLEGHPCLSWVSVLHKIAKINTRSPS